MGDRCVIFDVDGVILDYMQQFERYMKMIHGIEAAIPFSRELNWGLKNMYPAESLSGKGIESYMEKMSREHDFFSSIPYYEGAVRVLEAVHGAGIQIHLLTSCGDSIETVSCRKRNLSEIDPFIKSLTILPLGSDKLDHLSKHPEGTLFFDDSKKNIRDGFKAGLDCHLVVHPGHKAHVRGCFVSNWMEVAKIIEDRFGLNLEVDLDSSNNFENDLLHESLSVS